MPTGTAKMIQNESLKDNIFYNYNVNRGCLVSSCSSSGFSPAQLRFLARFGKLGIFIMQKLRFLDFYMQLPIN